jgi:uncharacterized protein YxjI
LAGGRGGSITTITEALEELHEEIEIAGISPTESGIYDDEDMTVFAIRYLAANLDHAFDVETMTRDEAVAEAKRIVAERRDDLTWPEDEWEEIGEGWDLNLFMDGDQRRASVYRVIEGNTQTQSFVTIL